MTRLEAAITAYHASNAQGLVPDQAFACAIQAAIDAADKFPRPKTAKNMDRRAKVSIEGVVSIDEEWTFDGDPVEEIFGRLVRKYVSEAITFVLEEQSQASFDLDFKNIYFTIPLLAEGDNVFWRTDFLGMIADEIEVRRGRDGAADSDACRELKATLAAGIALIDDAVRQ